MRFLYLIQHQEESAMPAVYSHLTSFEDTDQNTAFRQVEHHDHPTYRHNCKNEEDFTRAVYRDDLYVEAGKDGPWIQDALRGVEAKRLVDELK
jgi:hypothetical protein